MNNIIIGILVFAFMFILDLLISMKARIIAKEEIMKLLEILDQENQRVIEEYIDKKLGN